MKLLTFILFAVVHANSQVDPQFKRDCKIVRKTFRPKDCCKYPVVAFPLKISGPCYDKCKEEQNKDNSNFDCCYDACHQENFPLQTDSKINAANVEELFQPDIAQMNESESSDWKKAIEQSILDCEKMLPLMEELKCLGNETMESTLGPFLKCVLQMNFLNCPASTSTVSEKCDTMKTAVKTIDKCGHKFGETFILSGFLFINSGENETSSNETETAETKGPENTNE